MVIRYSENGLPYSEPPYTKEEEADFYRRVGNGPVTVVKQDREPARKEPPQRPAEPPRA